MSRPVLFTDRSCPFAHRVLALIDHLGLQVERREGLVGENPPGVCRYSARGARPLLVHGDLVLLESRVMMEHLAEHAGWAEALPPDLAGRTLHRHGMAVVDATLARWMFDAAEPDADRLEDACRSLRAATAVTPPRPGLLALHAASIWSWYRLHRPGHTVIARVRSHPSLARWLDAAASLPCITATRSDRAVLDADLARARRAGIVTFKGQA